MGRKRKTMKPEKLPLGTIYQAKAGGNYYLRYQIQGRRKNVCLKTSDYDEALKEYKRLLPTLQADTLEVVAAHVKVARRLGSPEKSLRLADVWPKYSTHPNRATPATVAEQINYQVAWEEFVRFAGNPEMNLHEITPELAEKFAEELRQRHLSVDTHNRKIKHLKKICNTLSEYLHGPNPFEAASLHRKHREEQNLTARRIGFSPDQILSIQKELDNPARKILNKPEIKVIFYIGMYTGQRLKDCVLLRWTRIDWTRNRVSVTQFKTGKQVSIPIAPQLATVLKEAQEWKASDPDYVCPKTAERYLSEDKRGKSYGNSLVNIDVMRVIRWV
ncbi:MAG: tyrosine-type recombinase/integrase, partial [Victivallales bacterium]|nr:tyrosine-type recombinase/integrase [Victivallales bacterium]